MAYIKRTAGKMLLINCILYNSLKLKKPVDILIENGRIVKIGKIRDKSLAQTIDCSGLITCPGFIDVHIQGAGGADVLDASYDALCAISGAVARYGVTGFLATTVYMKGRDNRHLQIAAENTGKELGGARLLGTHIEGPFISLKKQGMIQDISICAPSTSVYKNILRLTDGTLSMMTIAPEIQGALPIIKKLVKNGTVAAFAHSGADYEQTMAGIKAGINHVTHIFNAMMPIHHRDPGPLPAILADEKLSVQVITDGVHLHPSIVRMIYDTIGEDRFITITDGMQAMGLPEGKYNYNGIEYISKGGTARYKNGTLIGTATGISELLRRLVIFTGCSVYSAVKTVTENPAKLLKLDKQIGYIKEKMDADITLIDGDFKVFKTIVKGKVCYTSAERRR